MTLDELFLTYESAMERQGRLMKTVATALGASPEEEVRASSPRPGAFISKTGQMVTPFGYRQVEKVD